MPFPSQINPADMLPPSVPKVLLVTFNWSTLQEMPYLIKQAGCQVDVLCPIDNLAIKNGFYDRWIDAGSTMLSLLTVLQEIVKEPSYQHILIGDDSILWEIYIYKIATLWHLLPIKNESALKILAKVGFAEHCHRHQISSPEFRAVENYAMASEVLRDIGLPLVVKDNYSNGGLGVKIFEDEPAYLAYMAAYDFSQPLLAQKFIDGTQVGVDALFKNGKLLQYVCAESTEPTLGPSTKRRYFPNNDDIGQLVSAIGQSAKLHGFANISLVREKCSGKYYLFEADPRPTKWAPYGRWFGRDFSKAFKVFISDSDQGENDLCNQAVAQEDIECWEVEHFSSHFAKLINSGRYADVIIHLLDFERNLKYTVYDPVLLKFKMDQVHRQIFEKRDLLASKFHPQPDVMNIENVQKTARRSELAMPQGHTMPQITIDNHTYDLDTLSDEARAQLQSLQFVDAELGRMQAQTAVLQTARMAYSKALQAALPVLPVGGTMKFN